MAPGQPTNPSREVIIPPLPGIKAHMLISNLQALPWSLTTLLATASASTLYLIYTLPQSTGGSCCNPPFLLTVYFSVSHTQLRLWVIVCLFFHCITYKKGCVSVWWWAFTCPLVGSPWNIARRYLSSALSMCQLFVSFLIFAPWLLGLSPIAYFVLLEFYYLMCN